MFMEYDWCFDCYRFRFGDMFTDIRGTRYAETWQEAMAVLRGAGLRVGKKADTRTWEIKAA